MPYQKGMERLKRVENEVRRFWEYTHSILREYSEHEAERLDQLFTELRENTRDINREQRLLAEVQELLDSIIHRAYEKGVIIDELIAKSITMRIMPRAES